MADRSRPIADSKQKRKSKKAKAIAATLRVKRMARSKARAKIDRKVAVSNPDKVLYPGGKFTKGDVVEYYSRVARFLLPHFRNRPNFVKISRMR